MPLKYCFAIALLAITSLSLAQVPAIHSDTTHTLREITIAAASKADNRSPFAFQNLNSRQLKSISWGQEPALLLQQTPSVTAYSDAGHSNGYAYFRLRGIDQTRINTTLDGVPLNDPEDQGFYFANFPDFMNSVGNLQIQRGVGISKNGTASYGGSLQFESPTLSDTMRVNIGIDYGSFYTYRVFGEFQSGIKRHTGLYLRLSQQHSNGYKLHSANTGQSVFAALKWAKKRQVLRLIGLAGHQLNNGLAWLGVTKSAIDLDRRSNGNSPLETDDFMQALTQLQYTYYLNDHLTFSSGLYGIYSNGSYTFDLNNFIGLPSTDELYKYAFRAQLGGLSAHLSYEKGQSSITGGIHANTYSRRHLGSESTLGALYENTGYKKEASGFAKYAYRNSKWLFHTDLQYRYAAFDYTGTTVISPLSWHFFNPKAGITYQIKPNMGLYYSIGTTGREPTRNDMLMGNDDLLTDSLGNALLGNTDAEYVTDHELGLRLTHPKWNLNVNAYYMQFRNEIILNGQFGPNGLALTDNVKRSFRSGIECDSRLLLGKHIQVSHNISYNYSRITVTDSSDIDIKPILTPIFIFNQTATYSQQAWQLGIDLRYQSASYIDFANDNTLPAFWTVGANAMYQWKKWQLGLRLHNLLNEKYYSNGYIDFNGENRYFVQAPIHFTASFQWTL